MATRNIDYSQTKYIMWGSENECYMLARVFISWNSDYSSYQLLATHLKCKWNSIEMLIEMSFKVILVCNLHVSELRLNIHLNIIENFRIESLLYFHRQLIDMSLVLHWKFIEIRLKYDWNVIKIWIQNWNVIEMSLKTQVLTSKWKLKFQWNFTEISILAGWNFNL